jgi:chromosome segregation ATPase
MKMPAINQGSKVIPAPPVTDGSASQFWRCKKCAKVNFRSATLCSGCDQPQPHDDVNSSSAMLSPASAGYLRSSAAVAVNAKVANLQEMLEDQKKRYESDIITLRKQLDHALQAHNSLLTSQRQYMAQTGSSSGTRSSPVNTVVSHQETGYQNQIALLQEQLEAARKERDSSAAELASVKAQHQDLVGKCEVAATEYAAVMKQLEESEEARNLLLEKLQKPSIEPPVGGAAGIQAKSTAVMNLEREITELQNENENLRKKIHDLEDMRANSSTGPGLTSQHASGETLKGHQYSAGTYGQVSASESGTYAANAEQVVENLRSVIQSKLGAHLDVSIDQALHDAATVVLALKKENESLKVSNKGLTTQLDECEAELNTLETQEKEKLLEWERERDSLKRKIAQVEKEVQEADGRERDACLTMNAMDQILSDALFALRKVDEEKAGNDDS